MTTRSSTPYSECLLELYSLRQSPYTSPRSLLLTYAGEAPAGRARLGPASTAGAKAALFVGVRKDAGASAAAAEDILLINAGLLDGGEMKMKSNASQAFVYSAHLKRRSSIQSPSFMSRILVHRNSYTDKLDRYNQRESKPSSCRHKQTKEREMPLLTPTRNPELRSKLLKRVARAPLLRNRNRLLHDQHPRSLRHCRRRRLTFRVEGDLV
jgi:hypothetical protein